MIEFFVVEGRDIRVASLVFCVTVVAFLLLDAGMVAMVGLDVLNNVVMVVT
jgi:hypothetical protein